MLSKPWVKRSAKLGKPAVPALSGMLKECDPLVRKSAIVALGKIVGTPRRPCPVIAAFKAESAQPRMQSSSLRMVMVNILPRKWARPPRTRSNRYKIPWRTTGISSLPVPCGMPSVKWAAHHPSRRKRSKV